MNPSEPARSEAPLPRAALAALLLASAQAPLGSTLASVALPTLSQALAIDLTRATSWLVTSYLVVSIVGQSPGGRIGDLLGPARTVRLGLSLQAAATLLGLLSSQFAALVAARVGAALGGALVIPATLALMRARTPEQHRGRMFGAVSATMGLAAAIGPAAGGELVARFGWRAMFGAPLALGALAGLLVLGAGLPENTNAPHSDLRRLLRDFDGLGALLLTGWLCALFACSRTLSLPLFGAFVLALAAFVLRELRVPNPVFELRLFKQRGFTAGAGLIALHNFALYGLLFQLPGYFEHLRQVSPAGVGRTLFAMMIGMFAFSPVGGRLCDRIGPRASALLGAVPLAAGMLLLQGLSGFTRPSEALLGLGCVGAGVGLSNAPAMAAAMSCMPARAAASGAGAISTLRYLGGVLSILMLGLVLGKQPDGAAHARAVAAFGAAVLCATALALALPGKTARPGTG